MPDTAEHDQESELAADAGDVITRMAGQLRAHRLRLDRVEELLGGLAPHPRPRPGGKGRLKLEREERRKKGCKPDGKD